MKEKKLLNKKFLHLLLLLLFNNVARKKNRIKTFLINFKDFKFFKIFKIFIYFIIDNQFQEASSIYLAIVQYLAKELTVGDVVACMAIITYGLGEPDLAKKAIVER